MGLIIYGSIGEVSIGRLFAAGIIPGIMMMIALMIAVSYTSRKNQYMPERNKPPGIKEVLVAVKDGIWALIFPIILIVGIRYGIFTPSESGAFAAVYAIFIGAVVYRELTWKKFLETVQESAVDIGAIMLIISVSGIFGYGIVYDNVTNGLGDIITGITDNQYMLFGIIILALVIAGMFVETTVITLLLTPIFVPIVTSVGIDPVHFGLVMMTVTTFGIITPPMGVSLFTVSQIMGCSPQDTVKEAIPFYFATMLVVAIMVFFPDLILFVPDMVFGK
jgi:tripartite ATP-independent transporter DctM subunit